MPFLTPMAYLAVAAVAAFYAGLTLLTPFGEQQAFRFESYFPLRGRWLRIGLGLLSLLVSLFLFLGMFRPQLLPYCQKLAGRFPDPPRCPEICL